MLTGQQLSLQEYGYASTGLTISKYFEWSLLVMRLRHKIRMSLGTGRPIVLRDENSIRHCRLLLTHPMASPTDVRLIAQVELIAQKSSFVYNKYCILPDLDSF